MSTAVRGLLAVCALCALSAAGSPVRAASPDGMATPGPATVARAAEPADASYSIWTFSGRHQLLLRYLMPASAAQRVTGTRLALAAEPKLAAYLLQHLSVSSAGHACPAQRQGFGIGRIDPLAVGAGRFGFEIFFRCRQLTGLELHDSALFGQIPGHVDFARIQVGRRFVPQLFTAGRQSLRIANAQAIPAAGIGQLLPLGVRHLLSTSGLAVLIALLLLARSRRDLAALGIGLAGGYALALAISAGDWVLPRIAMSATFSSALLLLLVAGLVATRRGRRRAVAAGGALMLLALAGAVLITRGLWPALLLAGVAAFGAGWLELGVHGSAGLKLALPAAVFAFVDGFVLPSRLAPMHLSAGQALPMIAGFDLGTLIAAALVLGLLAGAAVLMQRRSLLKPQAILYDLAGACLGGLGAFWLLSALYR